MCSSDLVLSVDPEAELVIALLANRVWAGRLTPGIGELAVRIHEAIRSAVGGPHMTAAPASPSPRTR